MGYFPNRIMPLTVKENSSGASDLSSNIRITAGDYNLHDGELRAIEEYLGTNGGFAGLAIPASTVPDLQIFPGGNSPESGGADTLLDPSQGNIFNAVAQMVDIINNMSDYRGQGSSSGYLHSGQRMILPQTIHSTFLTNTPAAEDTSISVASTEGFPSSGVISILNDVQQGIKASGNTSDFVQNIKGGTSMVEWIRYTSKSPTAFLGCQRGYLGTHAGPHAGDFDAPRDSRYTRNEKDFCTFLDGAGIDVCDREWPWWRERTRYSMPFFGANGSLRDLKVFIRRFGPRFPLNAGRDPSSASVILSVADGLGILTTRSGVPYLQSGTQASRDQRLLTWAEASSYVNGLLDEGAVVEETISENFVVGNIPVFMGRLSVQHGISAITRVSSLNVDAISIVQSADARVFAFLQNNANKDKTLQAVINYHALFVGSMLSTSTRNNQ